MDKENRKQGAPEENEPPRLLTDPAEEVEHAEEERRPRYRNEGQTNHYLWGLSWYEFLTVTTVAILGVGTIIVTGLQWYTATVSESYSRQKERARIVLSSRQEISTNPLSFSLTFRNVGETTALHTYGAWLHGECQRNLSECVDWCLTPLQEQEQPRESYGHIDRQGTLTEEFFYTFTSGKSRKKHIPVYFCGYVAYTDISCVWHRKFHSFSYDPATQTLSFHPLSNDEEEAQVQNCRP